MSLSVTGPGDTAEHRWITYALLCDNMLHHLERAPRTVVESYTRRPMPAAGAWRSAHGCLRGELEMAAHLLDRPISDLAISARTPAVLDKPWTRPEGQDRTTAPVLEELSLASLAPGAHTLTDAFGNLIRSLLNIPAGASEDDIFSVEDA